MGRRAVGAIAVFALAAAVGLMLRTERPSPAAPVPATSATTTSRVESEHRTHDAIEKPLESDPTATTPAIAATVEVFVSAEARPVAGASVELYDGKLPPAPRQTTDAAGI